MAVRHSSIAGRLLVAAPVLTDPNFDRTVVLMMSHDLGGALGLVLNRLDPEPPSAHLAAWVAQGSSPRSFYEGGPVQRDGLIGVMAVSASKAAIARDEGLLTPFVTLDAHVVGTLDLARKADELDAWGLSAADVRVFRGYSGWGPGQLDHELSRPGWLVVDAEIADVFTRRPGDLWRRVLARQRAPIAWLAQFPDDLSAN